MPAHRNYTPAEEAVRDVLIRSERRRLLLASLEKKDSLLAQRVSELVQTPARPSAGDPQLPSGWWSVQQRALLQREFEELRREQALYDALLSALEPLEREVVRLRHEEKRTWVAIGQRVFLSDRQVQREYRTAIRKMGKLGSERNLFTIR